MRIAVASTGLGHVQRGIEAWALSLAKGLHREGEDVTLFCAAPVTSSQWPVASEDRQQQKDMAQEWGPLTTQQRDNSTTAPPTVVLPCAKRSDPWVRMWCRIMPAFTWRWGWKSAYEMEQRSFARYLIRYLRRISRGQKPEVRSRKDMVFESATGHRSPVTGDSSSFDVIHTQDVVLAEMLEKARESGRIRAKTILAHGTDESPGLLEKLHHVQYLSPHDYERRTRNEEQFSFMIPNFVDTERFCPKDGHSTLRHKLDIPEDAFVVGSAASLQKTRKRVDALIREVSRLATGCRPPATPCLLLAGASTDQTPGIEKLARDALGDRCHVLKDLPFDEMPDFYRALDLFVLPAPKEAFGICFLEAMACGVPVVGHDSLTLRWIVGNAGSRRHDDTTTRQQAGSQEPGAWKEMEVASGQWPVTSVEEEKEELNHGKMERRNVCPRITRIDTNEESRKSRNNGNDSSISATLHGDDTNGEPVVGSQQSAARSQGSIPNTTATQQPATNNFPSTTCGGWNVDVMREGFLAKIWDEVVEQGDERGKAGRKRVQEMFSWQAVYPQFMEMYEVVQC